MHEFNPINYTAGIFTFPNFTAPSSTTASFDMRPEGISFGRSLRMTRCGTRCNGRAPNRGSEASLAQQQAVDAAGAAYQRARRSFPASNTRMVLGVSATNPSCLNSLRVRINDSEAVPTMAARSSRER